MDKLFAPHYDATITHVAKENVVLAVQDKTYLNYTAHPETEGLGPIGNRNDGGAIGLVVHDTMAFNLEGAPLGLLNVQCRAREFAEAGSEKRCPKELPIEEKENLKWLVSYRAVAAAQKHCRQATSTSAATRPASEAGSRVGNSFCESHPQTAATFEHATEKLNWYAKRWGIEVYHRTLKSGCKIEARQLGEVERLEPCLAIDLVVAWRIFQLTKLGRDVPHVPCTVFFEAAEWKALVAYKTKNPHPPETPPSLREAVRMVASLGGFPGRKCGGEPWPA